MKLTIIIFSILLSFSCCSNDDTKNIEEEIEGPIKGEWSLIKYEAGFSQTLNFDPGEIIWEFQKNGILKVDINQSISSTPVLPTGEHVFLINEDTIIIDDIEFDYEIDNNHLIISDDPSADGFRIELINS